MRFPAKKSRLAQPYFEMTPMIDIVMQLNIFFILVLNFGALNVQADLHLPKADFAVPPKEYAGSRVILNFNRHGEWVVSNRVLSGLAEVENLLQVEARVARTAADGSPDLTIVVRADRMTPYEKIAPVIVACARFGIRKVAFMAETKVEPERG